MCRVAVARFCAVRSGGRAPDPTCEAWIAVTSCPARERPARRLLKSMGRSCQPSVDKASTRAMRRPAISSGRSPPRSRASTIAGPEKVSTESGLNRGARRLPPRGCPCGRGSPIAWQGFARLRTGAGAAAPRDPHGSTPSLSRPAAAGLPVETKNEGPLPERDGRAAAGAKRKATELAQGLTAKKAKACRWCEVFGGNREVHNIRRRCPACAHRPDSDRRVPCRTSVPRPASTCTRRGVRGGGGSVTHPRIRPRERPSTKPI